MLGNLSAEVLEHILAFLDRSDLSSLRLVSRSLSESTTAPFGKAWLRTVETDLSEEGIRRLETIADHEIFRNSVRTLRIIRSIRRSVHSTLGGERIWPRRGSSVLDFSSAVARNFQDTVQRLDNCITFEVCDRPGVPGGDDGAAFGLSPIDALHLVLSAMATGTRHTQTLRIYLERQPTLGDRRQFPSIAISPAMFLSLQDLDIFWHIRAELVWQFLNMITAATHLKRLHLNFGTSEDANGFLHQLAAVPTLPPIADLRLGRMISVSGTALVNVILRFQGTLRTLHIGHLNLDSGDWDSVFGTLSRHDFPCLESIALCFIRAPQPPDHNHTGTVYFCPLRLKQKTLERCGGAFEFMLVPDRGKTRVGGVRYTGSRTGTKLALEALADGSHYLLSRVARSPSPGLPNMKNFTGDRVGSVVPRFDQITTWNGLSS